MNFMGNPYQPGQIGGIKIFSNPLCLKDTTIRTFKKSSHRSARLHKKLIKKFDGAFKKEPAIYRQGNNLFCHPIFEQQLRQELDNSSLSKGYGGI